MREIVTGAGLGDLEEPAMLLTSELVTNAVLHARSAPEIVVRLDGPRLWVGVTDGTLVGPVRKHYGPQAGTGRGLLLVEHLASAWGTDTAGDGKIVWFELVAERDGPGHRSATAYSGGRAERDEGPGTGGLARHRRGPAGPKVPLRRPTRQVRRKGTVGR